MDTIIKKVRAVVPEELVDHVLKRRPEYTEDVYPLWIMKTRNEDLLAWAEISGERRKADA